MPQHGVDGWSLEDMDWDPETGLALFEYSNITGHLTVKQVRPQPTREGHVQWSTIHEQPACIFAMRS